MSYLDAQELIAREKQKRFAEQLRNMDSPQGQMISGRFVAPHALEYLAQGLRGISAQRGQDQAERELASLGQQRQTADTGAMQNFTRLMRDQPAREIQPLTPNDDDGNVNFPSTVDAKKADPMAAYGALMQADSQGMKTAGMQGMMRMPEIEAERAFKSEQAQTAATEKQENLKLAHRQRMDELAANNASKEQIAKAQREFEREMRGMVGAMRQAPAVSLATIQDPQDPSKSIIVDARTGNRIGAAPGEKNAKLPSSALKLQQEEIDAISTSGGIIADTKALAKQIADGKLNLGLVSNAINSGRNAIGLSSPEGENLASFKSNLQKLRNDSLRLNKGTQTEGDAVRAMDELMQGINDPAVVSRQLTRINEINQRAVALRKANVDIIRNNYGVAPLDSSSQSQQNPAIGLGYTQPQNAPAMPSGFKVIR